MTGRWIQREDLWRKLGESEEKQWRKWLRSESRRRRWLGRRMSRRLIVGIGIWVSNRNNF